MRHRRSIRPERRDQTRLPSSGPSGHIGATSGPRTTGSQRTTPVTSGQAIASSPSRLDHPPQVTAPLPGSLTRKRSQVQTLSRPPWETAGQTQCKGLLPLTFGVLSPTLGHGWGMYGLRRRQAPVDDREHARLHLGRHVPISQPDGAAVAIPTPPAVVAH
jgi:hypothetical protein